VAETLTCTSDDQRMPDKGRMQMVVQSVAPRGAVGINGDVAGTQDAYSVHGEYPTAMKSKDIVRSAFYSFGGVVRETGEVMSTLDAAGESRGTNQQRFLLDAAPASANYGERDVVVSMRESGQRYWVEDVVAGTLDANMGQSGHANRVATIAQIANYGERGVMQSIGVCVTGDRTHALKAEGADGSEDGTGRGTPIVVTHTHAAVVKPVAFTFDGGQSENPKATHQFSLEHSSPLIKSRSLCTGGTTMSVRRLTPVECERLQGFPDNWTAIPWRGKPVSACPDGPRYKALGNSMACNVMRWIGRRIELVDTA